MKKSFVLYLDSLDVLDELTNEQSGELLKAIKDLQNGIEPKFSSNIMKIVFVPFRNQLNRDNEKYKEICEARSRAGKKGNEKRWGKGSDRNEKSQVSQMSQMSQVRASDRKVSQSIANVAHTDTDSDSDSDSGSDIDKETLNTCDQEFSESNTEGNFSHSSKFADDSLISEFEKELPNQVEEEGMNKKESSEKERTESEIFSELCPTLEREIEKRENMGLSREELAEMEESLNLPEKKEDIVQYIIDFWNEQESKNPRVIRNPSVKLGTKILKQCRVRNQPLEKVIKKSIRENKINKEMITTAIVNYCKHIVSTKKTESGYHEHRFSLFDFFSRKEKGVTRFLNEEINLAKK